MAFISDILHSMRLSETHGKIYYDEENLASDKKLETRIGKDKQK